MDIKPIKTEQDYQEALREVDRLIDAESNTPDGDKLDILVTLIEAYEEKNHPVPPPEPIEAILQQMESQELSPKDLVPLLGSRSRVSEILNKKRSLSINMIRRLQDGLGISAEILIQSYDLNI